MQFSPLGKWFITKVGRRDHGVCLTEDDNGEQCKAFTQMACSQRDVLVALQVDMHGDLDKDGYVPQRKPGRAIIWVEKGNTPEDQGKRVHGDIGNQRLSSK